MTQKINTKISDELMEMPEEDKEQLLQKKRIDTLIETKPEVAAQQIHDWLNEE